MNYNKLLLLLDFRTRKISLGQPMHPPALGELVSLKKPTGGDSPKIGRPVYPAIKHILASKGKRERERKRLDDVFFRRKLISRSNTATKG